MVINGTLKDEVVSVVLTMGSYTEGVAWYLGCRLWMLCPCSDVAPTVLSRPLVVARRGERCSV